MSYVSRIEEICLGLKRVQDAIVSCSKGRDVRLVAVSKLKPVDDIKIAYDYGQRHFGENFVQEMIEKAKLLPLDCCWHFIGRLQTNKCKALASISNLWAVESLDSSKKAYLLNKALIDLKKSSGIDNHSRKLNVFVQVNTSCEEGKNGVSISDSMELCSYIINNCKELYLKGLMTIGSLSESNSEYNKDFEALAKCRDEITKSLGIELELSMGMSRDFELAIKMGSTNIRVGTDIFGVRPSRYMNTS
ncbi:YggS family pyridoxal phosphate enzyme [Pneumocystis murina B123]|uniref:Pyridoxal phosphate homeostasis protein n=1 Tax=Pneumocystis murina (strain B123) TaxID=1069680 RepID=M7PHA8_PNEMU|nr:YggS family pyridoxal phosphate enzyme [Pneumocystis murina B123]EMR09829.1 YggS family pyridoxal phosphate enzyme [Pneumocystis murina B123]